MDVLTFLIAITTVILTLALLMGLISAQHQAQGMALGSFALVSIASGILFLAYRDLVGDIISILAGNLLISTGLALLAESVLAYQRRHTHRWPLWLPVAILAVALIWWIDNMQARTVVVAIIFGIQISALLVVIIMGRQNTPGLGWRIIAVGAFAFSSVAALRGLAALLDGSLFDTLTTNNWIQSLTYLMALNAIVLYAIGLIAMSIEDTARSLGQAEQKFRAYIENANDVVYTLNEQGEFDYLSPNIRLYLGYTPEQLVGQHFSYILHPEDLPACESFFTRLMSTGKPDSALEYRARHVDGNWIWHDTNAAPLLGEHGELRGMLGIGRDINQRKIDELRLDQLAHYDGLTGLPNRMLIIDRIESATRRAKREDSQVAIMFLDLDGFKLINDQHGHDVGDTVLSEVGRRLMATVRESDSVGRLGGDEYVVLLPDVGDQELPLGVAQRIEHAVREPIMAGTLRITIGCSIGIALYPLHGTDVDTLIVAADAAMYRAKRAGGGVSGAWAQ